MTNSAINVLLVNDSIYMLKFLQDIINSDDGLRVVGTARDGIEALRRLPRLKPDVIVTDLEMPNLDGLSLISKIMDDSPTPIIVVSSYGQEGSQIIFDCLENGAIDFISLPHEKQHDISDFKQNLISKIYIAAKTNISKIKKLFLDRIKTDFIESTNESAKIIVVIGASTGGPRVVAKILSSLSPKVQAGFILVQHMPKGFTDSYTKRLNDYSKLSVKIAKDGDIIKQGQVLVAPADYHLMIVPPNYVYLDQSSKRFGVRPSINISMMTASEVFEFKTIGVLLTGMGHDGGFGMKTIKQRGGKTIGQDKQSCVVFGMPEEAQKLNSVDRFVSDVDIAAAIEQEVSMLV